MGAGAPDCLPNVDSLIIVVTVLQASTSLLPFNLRCRSAISPDLRTPSSTVSRGHPATAQRWSRLKQCDFLPFSHLWPPHSISHNQFIHWWPQCWHKQCRNSSHSLPSCFKLPPTRFPPSLPSPCQGITAPPRAAPLLPSPYALPSILPNDTTI